MQNSSLTRPAGGKRFDAGANSSKFSRLVSNSHRRLFDSAATLTSKLSATTTSNQQSTLVPPIPPKDNRTSTNNADSTTFPAWSYTVDEVAAYHDVDPSQGLNPPEVERRRILSGYNELDKPRRPPLWQQVWEQLDDPLDRELLLAAVVSLGLVLAEQGGMNGASGMATSSDPEAVIAGAVNGAASTFMEGAGVEATSGVLGGIQAYTEPIVIAAIVALNACIGVWQQQKAEKSLEVREMARISAYHSTS